MNFLQKIKKSVSILLVVAMTVTSFNINIKNVRAEELVNTTPTDSILIPETVLPVVSPDPVVSPEPVLSVPNTPVSSLLPDEFVAQVGGKSVWRVTGSAEAFGN